MVYICPGGNCTGIAIFFLTKCHIWNTLMYSLEFRRQWQKTISVLIVYPRLKGQIWQRPESWSSSHCFQMTTFHPYPSIRLVHNISSKMSSDPKLLRYQYICHQYICRPPRSPFVRFSSCGSILTTSTFGQQIYYWAQPASHIYIFWVYFAN